MTYHDENPELDDLSTKKLSLIIPRGREDASEGGELENGRANIERASVRWWTWSDLVVVQWHSRRRSESLFRDIREAEK